MAEIFSYLWKIFNSKIRKAHCPQVLIILKNAWDIVVTLLENKSRDESLNTARELK